MVLMFCISTVCQQIGLCAITPALHIIMQWSNVQFTSALYLDIQYTSPEHFILSDTFPPAFVASLHTNSDGHLLVVHIIRHNVVTFCFIVCMSMSAHVQFAVVLISFFELCA